MDAKYGGRKWKAFVYVMILESAVLLMAGVKMVGADEAAIISSLTVFMAACFGAINATLGFYFASNVAQKKVTGG